MAVDAGGVFFIEVVERKNARPFTTRLFERNSQGKRQVRA
jgi:hypothetical protein